MSTVRLGSFRVQIGYLGRFPCWAGGGTEGPERGAGGPVLGIDSRNRRHVLSCGRLPLVKNINATLGNASQLLPWTFSASPSLASPSFLLLLRVLPLLAAFFVLPAIWEMSDALTGCPSLAALLLLNPLASWKLCR